MQKLYTYPIKYKNGDRVLFNDRMERKTIFVNNFFDFMRRVEETFSEIHISITIDKNTDFDIFNTNSEKMVYFWWNYEAFCIQAKYFKQFIKNTYDPKTPFSTDITIYNFKKEKSGYDFTLINGST